MFLSEPSAFVGRCRIKDMSDGAVAVMLVTGRKKFWMVMIMFDLNIFHPGDMESVAIDGVMEMAVSTLPK